MRFIGHAGLSIGRPGGTPTRQTLAAAARAHIDRLEVDVCRAADGTLVLRHDLDLPSGRRVATLSLADVRREDPEVLTLDEAAEVLGDTLPVLVDLKDAADAGALAAWLAQRRDRDRWAVCTDDRDALVVLRDRAPHIARWRGLPRVASGRGESVRRAVACALRGTLAGRLGALAREVGAAAFTVDRWAVTPRLCAEAGRLHLPVAAWTVNSPAVARRMAAAGVDFITTDRVEQMRAALGAQDGAATGRCDP